MKTNLLFIQFILASILFGIGADSKSLFMILTGLAFLILTIALMAAISRNKREA